MIRTIFSVLILSLATSAFAGVSNPQAEQQTPEEWQASRDRYSKVPGFERKDKMQNKFDALQGQYSSFSPPAAHMKKHPYVRPDYKGATVASAVDGSFRDIQKYKAGMEAFTREVEALSREANRSGDGDAPNRFLVNKVGKSYPRSENPSTITSCLRRRRCFKPQQKAIKILRSLLPSQAIPPLPLLIRRNWPH